MSKELPASRDVAPSTADPPGSPEHRLSGPRTGSPDRHRSEPKVSWRPPWPEAPGAAADPPGSEWPAEPEVAAIGQPIRQSESLL